MQNAGIVHAENEEEDDVPEMNSSFTGKDQTMLPLSGLGEGGWGEDLQGVVRRFLFSGRIWKDHQNSNSDHTVLMEEMIFLFFFPCPEIFFFFFKFY